MLVDRERGMMNEEEVQGHDRGLQGSEAGGKK